MTIAIIAGIFAVCGISFYLGGRELRGTGSKCIEIKNCPIPKPEEDETQMVDIDGLYQKPMKEPQKAEGKTFITL